MHRPADQHWREEARCAETDPEIFFPEPGQSPAAAQQVCADCPVRATCLADALDHRDIAYGVRGGLTATQRGELLRRGSRRAA